MPSELSLQRTNHHPHFILRRKHSFIKGRDHSAHISGVGCGIAEDFVLRPSSGWEPWSYQDPPFSCRSRWWYLVVRVRHRKKSEIAIITYIYSYPCIFIYNYWIICHHHSGLKPLRRMYHFQRADVEGSRREMTRNCTFSKYDRILYFITPPLRSFVASIHSCSKLWWYDYWLFLLVGCPEWRWTILSKSSTISRLLLYVAASSRSHSLNRIKRRWHRIIQTTSDL